MPTEVPLKRHAGLHSTLAELFSGAAILHLPQAILRLIDSCITQLEAQGPSRNCNESKEEEEKIWAHQIGEPGPFSLQI